MNNSASGMAIASLILGIVSWVLGVSLLASIPGAIIGKMELNNIAAGSSSEAGKTLATIGFWVSMANIILSVLGMCAGCVVWLFMFGGMAMFGLAGAAG